jgi:hypothetical protein
MEAWFTFKSPFSTVRLGKLFKIAQTGSFAAPSADHPPAARLVNLLWNTRSISPEPLIFGFLGKLR